MLMSSLLLLSAPFAYAASADLQNAERKRLSSVMRTLAKKGHWAGVDKNYREMLKLTKATIRYEDHYLGGDAAFKIGNIRASYKRFNRALEAKPDPQAQRMVDAIIAQYIPVEIVIYDQEVPVQLEIKEVPFDPMQQKSIEYAKKALTKLNGFKGMLPKGDYSVGSTVFKLDFTQNNKKQLAPKVFVEVGERHKITFGPRLDLGASFAQAGAAAEGSGMNSGTFNGAGSRIGVGVSANVTKTISVVLEVGYHNILSSGQEVSDTLQRTRGFMEYPTRYHSGFGWLAVGYDSSKYSVLVGPTIDVATAEVQGLDRNTIDLNVSISSAQYQPMEGQIRAGGFSGGFTYNLFPIGSQLYGGISSMMGAQYDSARWYSWGQLALTISPLRK